MNSVKNLNQKYKAQLLELGRIQRVKPSSLSLSEVLTIIIHFHQSNHRNPLNIITRTTSVFIFIRTSQD